MRFACNLNVTTVDAINWAARREAEGWHRLMVSDHIVDPAGPSPHVWSVLGALAATTEHVQLGTGFHCNLFRHPVEFAQASLSVQQLSVGRFEAGLGAGWTERELLQTGRAMPAAPERANMVIEATQIVRELFATGACQFDGRHYRVDIAGLDRLDGIGPPPLVVAAGGPRVIRGVAPYIDKLELIPAGRANRGGSWDREAYGALTTDDVRALIDVARSARDDLTIQLHVACRVRVAGGRPPRTSFPPDSFLGAFYGAADSVASALLAIEDLGLDEVHIGPHDEHTYVELAPRLLGPAVRSAG
jgi:alkanesulfonate monooxygenase SsuD/methylene tetrahydromethanopterin reductase-like flavin-dependent oxidoreductase (luciferase family)